MVEIAQLDRLKNKLKQVDLQVIQDVYDVFQSVGITEELMKMTFPRLYDQKAVTKADMLIKNS